jgi:hypothetical protein
VSGDQLGSRQGAGHGTGTGWLTATGTGTVEVGVLMGTDEMTKLDGSVVVVEGAYGEGVIGLDCM